MNPDGLKLDSGVGTHELLESAWSAVLTRRAGQ